VGRLDRFWYEAGLTHEAEYWTDLALKLIDEEANSAVVARLWLARSYGLTGAQRVLAAQKSADFYALSLDREGLARSLRALGGALRIVGRIPEARETLERSVSLLSNADDPGALSLTLSALGASYAYNQEYGKARDIYAKALNVAKSSGAQYALMMAHLHMADLEFSRGDCPAAIDNAVEACNLAEATMNSQFYANIKQNIAAYRIAADQQKAARQDASDALEVFRRNQDGYQVANVLLRFAALEARDGAAKVAARLVGYSDAYMRMHGIEREPTESWVRTRAIDLLKAYESDAALTPEFLAGEKMSEDAAVQAALEQPGSTALPQ